MKKWVLLAFVFTSVCAHAEYVINPDDPVKLGVGAYVRGFTGKMENLQYNNALKSQAYIHPVYDINDEWSLSGRLSGRYILDDRFPGKNKFKIYDAYGTIESKMWGRLDAGDINNVAYQMHQGPLDVGLLDIDDSDIYLFYKAPKNFYAPMLTYINTDSRDAKVSYTTPFIGGFKWGLSAVQSEDGKPDTCASGGIKMDHGKGVITSVQYIGDIKTVHIGLSAGFAYYHDDRYFFENYDIDSGHSEYSTGINLEKNNFSIGAAYHQIMYHKKTDMADAYTWTAGVAYDDDTYGVSLGYLWSQAEFIEKNTFEHLMLSGKYQINKYVKAVLSVGQLVFKTNDARRQDGWFSIAGAQFRI